MATRRSYNYQEINREKRWPTDTGNNWSALDSLQASFRVYGKIVCVYFCNQSVDWVAFHTCGKI